MCVQCSHLIPGMSLVGAGTSLDTLRCDGTRENAKDALEIRTSSSPLRTRRVLWTLRSTTPTRCRGHHTPSSNSFLILGRSVPFHSHKSWKKEKSSAEPGTICNSFGDFKYQPYFSIHSSNFQHCPFPSPCLLYLRKLLGLFASCIV